ncbi:MAG: hypothetical protein ACOY3P_14485 [Planctomycetota bacterium]
MRPHIFFLALLAATAVAPAVRAEGWIFRPSTFSHDPQSCLRVAQYAAPPTPYRRVDPTYVESGYRHNRSALRGADGSYDYQHTVQTWGLGELIRPYGEWQFPYRAGATPYGPWGNAQGPWTLPFDSWRNPYGLGRLPRSPWYLFSPYDSPLSGPWTGTLPPGTLPGVSPYTGPLGGGGAAGPYSGVPGPYSAGPGAGAYSGLPGGGGAPPSYGASPGYVPPGFDPHAGVVAPSLGP